MLGHVQQVVSAAPRTGRGQVRRLRPSVRATAPAAAIWHLSRIGQGNPLVRRTFHDRRPQVIGLVPHGPCLRLELQRPGPSPTA
ncbi:hypothetical protein ACW23B_14010 [Streptomyces albidoflavus]